MMRILKKREVFFGLFVLFSLVFIYRDVIFRDAIIFPSNFLATFYSPWATSRYPDYPNGIPYKPVGGNDNVRMFYPYRTFINQSLAGFKLPLWNPYNFSGSPMIADFQSAVFYPLNIIYFFLPQITAWQILVFMEPLLGTIFMYLFLKQFIRERRAVTFGAISFGFSGFIVTWSMENTVVAQTALWLPLILYAVNQTFFSNHFRYKYFLLLVISLSAAILAGFLQIAFYIFLISFLYGVYKFYISKLPKKTYFLLFLSSFILSFSLSAIQLMPSIEAFSLSTRGSTSARQVIENQLIQPKFMIKTLASDIFGNSANFNYFGQGFYHESILYLGIIPLVFALLALVKSRNIRGVKFFGWATFISLLFGIKSPFSDWFYGIPIPLIKTFTPSRVFYVTSFSLSVLSAYGFSYWQKEKYHKSRRFIFYTVLLFALILILYVGLNFFALEFPRNFLSFLVRSYIGPQEIIYPQSVIISARNIILPLFMLLSLVPLTIMKDRSPRFAQIAVLILASLGLFYFLNKYKVTDSQKFLYPDHFVFADISTHQEKAERFLTFGLPILGDVNLQKYLYSPDGIDPVFPKRYGQLVWAAKNGGIFSENYPPRIEVALSEYAENRNIIGNPYRNKLISLLGVARIYNFEKDYQKPVDFATIFPPAMYKLLWNRDGWQAYENMKVYPRAYLASDYLVGKDPQQIIDLMFDKDTNLRNTIILEEDPRLSGKTINIESGDLEDKAEIKIYQPEKVQIETATNKDKLLFLSDNFYPGWQATIDGKETKIYRADFTFRAVIVPEGKHNVTFTFRPRSFIIGSMLTLSAIFILSVVALFQFFPKKYSKNLCMKNMKKWR